MSSALQEVSAFSCRALREDFGDWDFGDSAKPDGDQELQSNLRLPSNDGGSATAGNVYDDGRTDAPPSGGSGEGQGQNLSPSEQRLANVGFLIIGVGVAMCWTMLQSGIAYFSVRFPLGRGFYAVMLTTYNVPVLPLLVAQTLFDRKFDAKYGSYTAYVFRFSFSMVILTLCLILVPFLDQTACLVFVALVGVFDSVAFGTATQLFSIFPARTGAYYFIGASLTSVLSIAITFASGFAREDVPTLTAALITYGFSAAVTLIGLIVTLFLCRSSMGRRLLAAKTEQDQNDIASTAKNNQEGETKKKDDPPAMDGEQTKSAAIDVPHRDGDSSAHTASLTNRQLIAATSNCHVALFLVWMISTWVGSLVSYVPSQLDEPGAQNQQLKLTLVYTSMISGLVGKQFIACRRGRFLRDATRLLIAVTMLVVYALPFFAYILQPFFFAGSYGVRIDGLAIAYLAIFSMYCAYLSSLCYSMAAQMLHSPTDKAQSSSLLSITLMIGIYVGLGLNYACIPVLDMIQQ